MDSNDPHFGTTYAGYAESFTILAKYSEETYQVNAEHDVIYAGPGMVEKVSEDDKARLKELGWRINEEYHCFTRFC